jgi:lysophospholipase L1-like esterase
MEDWVRFRADLIHPYSFHRMFRWNPEVGKEGIPHVRFRKWKLNALGYRSAPPQQSSETVLFYGASETFGTTEAEGMEYPQQFAALVRARFGQRFTVVNAGIPGLRIGHLGYLDAALERSRPQHVFIYPSPANYIETDEAYCQKAPTKRGLFVGNLADHVRLIDRMRDAVKTAVHPDVWGVLPRLIIWNAQRSITVHPRAPQAWLDAFEQDLICVVKRVVERGGSPYLVTHATYFGEQNTFKNRNLLISWRRFYPSLAEEGFLDLEQKINLIIDRVARDHTLALIPAHQLLPGGPDHFSDAVHFTEKGAANMAAILFRFFAHQQDH